MTQRLSKLAEYLYNNNFEMAVQHVENSRDSKRLSEEPEEVQILLAKAYFLNQKYSSTIELASKLKDSRQTKVVYEASFLEFKAMYMQGQCKPDPLKNLLIKLRKEGVENLNRLSKEIEQVLAICQKSTQNTQNFGRSTIVSNQKRQFDKIMKEEDDRSIIMDGMPMFLISKTWFQSWIQYTSTGQKFQRERRHPGPITQFDIVDHIYNIFFDSRSSKDYTNRYVLPSAQYEIVPKKCWMYLKEKYGGIEVKRFNISFIDKPYEVITEVHLKRIQIAKVDRQRSTQKQFVFVQITKKQNWDGLKNKLAGSWGQGQICQDDGKINKQVTGNAIFDEVDTVGKKYLYVVYAKGEEIKKYVEKCQNRKCAKSGDLKLCQCKTVKYCNMECLKQDWKNHKTKCQAEQSYLKKPAATFKEYNLEEKDYGGRKGVVGLKNLGNTCYMNSGLQCLSNTRELTHYFMADQFKSHINNSNPLGTKGNLACAYAELIRQMWTGTSQSLAPTRLKKKIGQFATQFSGYGQQDSQQFISYLIDGLQQDLNLVKKKQTFEIGDDIKPDEEMSRQRQQNDQKRIRSFIRNIMVGQFKSTVICGKCQHKSVCFDPYMLITLPIPSSKDGNFFFVPTVLSKGAIKISLEYTGITTLRGISQQFTKQYNDNYYREIRDGSRQVLHPQRIFYIGIDPENFRILSIFNPDDKINNILSSGCLIFFLQLPVCKKDELLILCEYEFEKELSSYPRLIKLPRSSGTADKEAMIYESLKRGIKDMKEVRSSYHQLVIRQKPSSIKNLPFQAIVIEYRRKLKLPTFLEGYHEGFNRRLHEDDDTSLSLYDCFQNFSHKEKLQKQNTVYCSKCKEHRESTKQMDVYKTNKILVLAFKRFNRHRKITVPVDFPLEGLDIGPYVLSNGTKQPMIYDLYGVVNHHGSLYGGHYTAYCQNFLDKKWYEFNDSRVSPIGKKDVASQYSYVLFYRKRQK